MGRRGGDVGIQVEASTRKAGATSTSSATSISGTEDKVRRRPWVKLEAPSDARVSFVRGQLVLQLKD
jgi:hypothetical protein